MKKITTLVVVGLVVLYGIGIAQADPLDLSTFNVLQSQAGSVVESGGDVSFTENMFDAALYFYDDHFSVDPLATTLSFDYDITLGQSDAGDYLQFNVNYTEQWYAVGTDSGHFEFDLTAYQGTTISLDWALVWNGDLAAGTTAGVHNIDLATQGAAPVPEPATILLFGTGLSGLYAMRRRRNR